VPNWVLSSLLLQSVRGALFFAGGLVIAQIAVEVRNNAKLRRLKFVQTGLWVECKPLYDPQAYHLFLSHACASSARHRATPHSEVLSLTASNLRMAGPAAQDRMRAVKARLLECLPSCRTFLDVDGNFTRRKPVTARPSRARHND
jgi:hypothetical protein